MTCLLDKDLLEVLMPACGPHNIGFMDGIL